MTTRTFTQRGQAYGSSDVTIVAKIDGVEVFNGAVSTYDEPYQLTGFASDEWLANGSDLFSWEDDLEFAGTKTMEITVSNGFLVVMDTVANYTNVDFNGTLGPVFVNTVGDITYTNSTTNIVIDGALQNQDNGALGQTYWPVPPGSTYSCTVNVTAGILPTPRPPGASGASGIPA